MAKTVIVMTDGFKEPQVYSNLKKMCEKNPTFGYHTLKTKKFPFTYDGRIIYKSTIQ